MVDNPTCSDVTFICEDGEQIRASRMLLVAKCPVLKSMLSNGIAESNQSKIALPQVSSDAFLVVLKFLYTGELWEEDLKLSNLPDQDAQSQNDRTIQARRPSHFSLDWLFIVNVLKAARFFLLDELERLIVERLWPDLPRHIFRTEETLNQVTERLTILCSSYQAVSFTWYGCFTEKVIGLMCLQMIRIMFESELSEIHLKKLSYGSMGCYLSHTRHSYEEESWTLSFREYVRLWQLLTWCINRTTEINTPCQEASILRLVEPRRAASILVHPEEQKPMCDELSSQMSSLREKFIDRIQRGNFHLLKVNISLVCIHPELLISIVEPLGIFSSSELGVVIRDQLVRASRWRKQIQIHDRKCQWLVIDRRSAQLVTHYSLPSDKLAVGNVAMWCQHVYEWEIVQIFERSRVPVRGVSDPLFTLEVGFLNSEPEESIQYSRLSDSSKGWSLIVHNCVVEFVGNGKKLKIADGKFSEISPPPMEAKSRTTSIFRVNLKLDRTTNICSFSFGPDGEKHHVVCANLGTELLFPAVHVSYYEKHVKGETRIHLSSGFEFSEHLELNTVTGKLRKAVDSDSDIN